MSGDLADDVALGRIAHSVLDGSAILFVGAGVSFLSKNEEGNALPNGEALRFSLQEQAGVKKTHTLEKIASFFVKKFGSYALYDKLRRELQVSTVDRDLADLYKCPWRRIYTTNYDDAIEVARKSTRGFSSYAISDSVKSIS